MRTSRMVSSRFAPSKPGAMAIDQVRRRQHAQQHEHGDGERQDRAHRAGYASGFLLVLLRQQARIHRNEGRREHAFAEEILQEIGNPEGRVERVRGVRVSRSSARKRAAAPAPKCGDRIPAPTRNAWPFPVPGH